MTTMRKRFLAVLVLVAISVVFGAAYIWQTVPLVHFAPVRMDASQRLQASNELLTKEQADRVEAVLQQYGERYRRADSDIVFITLGLSGNRELVWNYTTKSGL